MGDRKRLRRSNYLGGAFDSASDSDIASGAQTPQQAALSLPILSRSSRLRNKFKRRSPSPLSPPPPPPPLSPSPSPSLSHPVDNTTEPSAHTSELWAKVLEIANKKLRENNLPLLNLTSLTPQLAEGNIQAVVKGLNTLQQDDNKKRWSYTWRGKKVIVVERLGKILKCVERYSKVVDTAIQSNPQVCALVWAGIWAILRVCHSGVPFTY